MPPAFGSEILDILQGLKGSWPHCETLTWSNVEQAKSDEDFVNHHLAALQWLTDMGMVTFEALSVGPDHLAVRQASLTSRGRDYIQSTVQPIVVDRQES